MGILIVAEHDNSDLKPATLNTLAAAAEIGGDVDVLVAGSGCRAAADGAAALNGVMRVLIADAPEFAHHLAENTAPMIAAMADAYTHLLAPATTFGKNLMPRVAALLDVSQISDISAVVSADTFERPIYAGNALATVQSADPIKIVTVRTTAFEAAPAGAGTAPIEAVGGAEDLGLTTFVSQEVSETDRPELTTARVVVSGGRGMQDSEHFRLLEDIADKLGGAIGASRAAVDAGYVPNDYQVGQTGKVVAPDLYIAVGISGAIQHLAGMKDSKVIVAINKDADAPIFAISDYGLVADLFVALPELASELDKL